MVFESNCSQIILLVVESLEYLSISKYHRCDAEPDLNYNSYSLSNIFSETDTSSIIQLGNSNRIFRKNTNENLVVKDFVAPFWLDESFLCKRVCVDFDHICGLVQIFSLPYTFISFN